MSCSHNVLPNTCLQKTGCCKSKCCFDTFFVWPTISAFREWLKPFGLLENEVRAIDATNCSTIVHAPDRYSIRLLNGCSRGLNQRVARSASGSFADLGKVQPLLSFVRPRWLLR